MMALCRGCDNTFLAHNDSERQCRLCRRPSLLHRVWVRLYTRLTNGNND